MRRKSHRNRRPPAKIGVPPGTLIHVGERKAEKIRIRLIDYDAGQLREEEIAQIAPGLGTRDTGGVRWLNIEGLHDIAVIEELGRTFGVHPLVQEDILNTAQRPKLEDYGDYLFLVVKALQLDPDGLRTEQISFVLGPGYLLTFQEQAGDDFDQVRERLRASKGRIRRQGADYLAYALLDAIVDSYFVILEALGDRIEALEDELVGAPSPNTLQKIHHLKREMIHLRKSIWPLREVLAALQRQEPPLVQEGTRFFLRDIYDHTIQVIDTVETYRDILAGMLDLYLSSLSHRMNEVMKVLTIIATIFIPLTFIAGVYGMNFDYLPELHWKWSYPVLWLLMLASVAGMLVFFRKKKWL